MGSTPTPGTRPGAQTILYHYDQDDHLIAETRSDGTPLRTYVWLAERPLTVIEHAAVSNPPRSLHLQHDHLGTPRLAKNDAGVIQWRWDSDGYGTTTPTHDPDGDGKATVINLRFPGQYYDQESGLYYNWNRYYSPRLGRYLSPDPIGIEGGPNGYAYVEGNPLSLIDPDGLMGRGSGANGGTPTWGKGGPRPLGGSESGGFVPSKTYCGSGPNEPLVPDWLYGVNISKACYNHDICYDQCGKSKAQCDNDLRRDIERACNSAPSQQIRQECYRMARQYQWAVQSFASGAYDDAQKAGCCKK